MPMKRKGRPAVLPATKFEHSPGFVLVIRLRLPPCACARRRSRRNDTQKKSRFSGMSLAGLQTIVSMRCLGAGDGIRTHDPNLGKVVLYP